jgi:hypothetical protein
LSQAIEAMGEALAVAQSYGLNFEDLDLEKNLIFYLLFWSRYGL